MLCCVVVGLDHREVVDPGRDRLKVGVQVGLGARVHVAADLPGGHFAEAVALVADLDAVQAEGVKDELDGAAAQVLIAISYWLPCSETVADFDTTRRSDHKNASCSFAGAWRGVALRHR